MNQATKTQIENDAEKYAYHETQFGKGIDMQEKRDFIAGATEYAELLEQEKAKGEKLVEALEEYLELLEESYVNAAQFCYVHGIKPSQEDVEKGKQLRAKIESLK